MVATLDGAKEQHQEKANAEAVRFAFGGAVENVLREYLAKDMNEARLSRKFQLYYRVRHLIPIPLRQLLQKQRNQQAEVPKDWYLDRNFVEDFAKALSHDSSSTTLPLWPNDAQVCISLTHDVETQDGFEQILPIADLEEKYGFRSVWNFIPYKYNIDPGLIKELKARGHEIGIHGYNHDGRLFENSRTFSRRAVEINKAASRYDAVGFRAPMVHRNLRQQQDLDIDWDASCFDIDPFQAMPGGVGGVWPFIFGRFVELPYTLPQDHTLFVSLGQTNTNIWINKFRYLRDLSGLAMLITHPDYLDSAARLQVYADFLGFLQDEPNCWRALPREIAKWWRSRDSQLNQTEETDAVPIGELLKIPELPSS